MVASFCDGSWLDEQSYVRNGLAMLTSIFYLHIGLFIDHPQRVVDAPSDPALNAHKIRVLLSKSTGCEVSRPPRI
jgi:hypothetical protein